MTTLSNVSDSKLIALAGQAAFTRGLGYFEKDRVESWSQQGNTITGTVLGTETYQVSLTLTPQRLEGYCDCPASEGFDFCKHCVATALQYRADSGRQAELEGGSVEQRIEAYINRLSKAQLSQHLLALILADRAHRNQWSIMADVALNRMDAREIKKRITAAIPYNKHLFRQAQVRSFFRATEPVVELLEQQLLQLDASSGLQLVEYALQRLQRALTSVDDSGGFRLPIVDHLQRLHQATLWRLGWEKTVLVKYLQALEAGPTADMYPDFPFAYRDLLQEDGMVLVYQALQKEWDALPALTPGAGWEQRSAYTRLEHLLRQRAEAVGDTAAVICLLQKTATEQRHFLDLCDLCMEAEDWRQAEHYLGAARKLAKPAHKNWNRDFRLERTEQRIFVQQGKLEQALELQWQIFRGAATLENYLQLLALGARVEAQEKLAEQAKQWLQSKLRGADQNLFSTRFADTLVEIGISEKNRELALDTCRAHRVGATALVSLARSCVDAPELAIPLYSQLVALELAVGKNAAYRRAVVWLLEAREMVKTASDERVFNDTLAALRSQFKIKRNFMQYLDEAF